MKVAIVVLVAAVALPAARLAHAQTDPASPTPPAADGAVCTPACSPGYDCVEGACVTRCNPACQRGEYCNEMRLCALIPAASMPTPVVVAPPHRPDPAIEAFWQAANERRQRDLTRVQARTRTRLTLGLGFAISDLEKGDFAPSMMGLVLRAGWRKNLLGWLGLQLEAEGSLGHLRGHDVQIFGSSLVSAWGASGGVFFNAGRCYMGPYGAFERRTYSATAVEVAGRPYDLDRFGPWHGTVGGQIGLLLMGKDQLDVNLRTGGVQPEDGFVVMLSAGYHFLL
jgi:hypothetical protein